MVVLYGQLVFGYPSGTRLPVQRVRVATVAGVAVFLLALELVAAVPAAGDGAQTLWAAVGFAAVLNTYFGLQRFEPVTIRNGTPQ